ncbi:MAG TPA: hypothetical protein VF392_00465 [Terracidiphilus sp.]
MPEVMVTVTMNPLELKLFRRALAKAVDDGLLERTPTLHRICALDVSRWKAEAEAEALASVRRVPRIERPAVRKARRVA